MVTYNLTTPFTWGFSNSPFKIIYNLDSASASITDLNFLGRVNHIVDTTTGPTVSVTQSVVAELSLPLRPDNKSVLDLQLLKSKFIQFQSQFALFDQRLTNYVRTNVDTGFEANPNLTFSNIIQINSKVALQVASGLTSSFVIGDEIGIDLDNKFDNPTYDGYTFINSFSASNIVTEIPWGFTSSATQSGSIFYLKRYNNTTQDYFLVEGARQYDNNLFNLDSLYIWGSTNWEIRRVLSNYPLNYTNNSNTKKVYLSNGYETQMLLTSQVSNFKDIVIDLYYTNDENITRYTIPIFGTSSALITNPPAGATSSSNSWKMFEIGLGPRNIYSIIDVVENALPTYEDFFADVYLYSITFRNQSNVSTQRIFRQIACNPSPYPLTQVIFKNRLGGYDYYNFTEKTTKRMEVTKTGFKRPLDPTRTLYSGSNLRQNVTTDVKFEETITISTDWMTEDEYNWLNELLTSEDVYIIEGLFQKPIQIVETNFEYKTYQNQDIFILFLTFKYAFDKLA